MITTKGSELVVVEARAHPLGLVGLADHLLKLVEAVREEAAREQPEDR
jgi:hypothetical protein